MALQYRCIQSNDMNTANEFYLNKFRKTLAYLWAVSLGTQTFAGCPCATDDFLRSGA